MTISEAIKIIQANGHGQSPVPVTYSQWDNQHGWAIRVDDASSIGRHWYVITPGGHLYGYMTSHEVPSYFPPLSNQDINAA